MPEGPEVRREADRIEAAVRGEPLTAVFFGLPRLKRFEAELTGSTVTAVETRGKALLTRFDNGLTLYSHNQLYGKWMVRKQRGLPKTNRSLRVGLHTEGASALLYSASEIEVLDTEALALHPFLMRLGPDVLSQDLDWRGVAAQLMAPEFRGRSLAALYLDQHCLAGIGNYLRSEILFDAGLAPSRKPKDLTRGELGRLARSTLSISRRTYETGGLTNPPRRVARLKNEGLTRAAYRFAVFDRQHEPCYECGTEIQRITATSRRLYFCPRCQPE
ncbi:MAG: endonuclease VIII [Pseudomonadota bacterium]